MFHTKVHRISEWNRFKRDNAVGKKVDARVVEHRGSLLLCVVGRKIPAVVRRREIAWDPQKQDLEEQPVGSYFDAVVIEHDDDRRQFILSVKAAAPLPFDRYCEEHRSGEIVEGTIARFTPKSVILRLDGGLEAEVPRTCLPEIPDRHPEMTHDWELKESDHLAAKIEQINRKEQRIELNVAKAIEELTQQDAEFIGHARERNMPWRARKLKELVSRPSTAMEARATTRLNVLVVDDEPDIATRLHDMLRERTHFAVTATTAAAAQKAIAESEKIDAAVIDLQLQGESAVTVIREARTKFPQARLVVLTGNIELLTRQDCEFADVVMEKRGRLFEVVTAVEGQSPTGHARLQANLDEAVSSFSRLDHRTASERLAKSTLSLIDDHLASFLDRNRHGKAAVLAYVRDTNEVRCLRAANASPDDFARWSNGLRYSWIGDVLRGHSDGPFRVDLEKSHMDSLTHLMRHLSSSLVYGLPLEVETQTNPLAVFVFFPKRDEYISAEDERHLRHQVTTLSLGLDRAGVSSGLKRNQRALCVGSLMLGMTHEFRNVVFSSKARVEELEELLSGSGSFDRAERLERQQDCLDTIHRRLEHLESTFESFLGLARAQKSESKSLLDVLYDSLRDCQDFASQANITLVFDNEAPESIGKTMVDESLHQVTLNLLLNGLQHTRFFRPSNGFVRVSLSTEVLNDRQYALIRVQDNAFGIDWANRDLLFEMFFTSRQEGSGLGLYVSQLIVEGLGGELQVDESQKFRGTTFLVRIPVST